MGARFARYLALSHGAFYVITGLWPVVDMKSFEAVTGRKEEHWLVKTVGLLLGVIGTVLLAGSRRRVEPELRLLAAGSALSLAGIDIVYWKRGRLLPIYLLDAAGELVLSAGWLATGLSRKKEASR